MLPAPKTSNTKSEGRGYRLQPHREGQGGERQDRHRQRDANEAMARVERHPRRRADGIGGIQRSSHPGQHLAGVVGADKRQAPGLRTHDDQAAGAGLRTSHQIESGWVQVNQGLGQTPEHSYGGYKQSGLGREFSLEGMLDSLTQRRNVTVNLETPARGR